MNNLSGFLSFHGNVSGQMGSNLITNVEANPAGTPTEILTSIRVGDIIYSIPSGGGGGGGTNNYNDLLNKPKINNVILSGDLSLSDLGIYNPVVMTGATASSDGAAGYVPRPLIADKDKFLKGDGTWGTVSSSDPTFTELWINTGVGLGVYALNDDIDNYDFIELYIGRYSEYTGSPYLMRPEVISVNACNFAHDNSKHLLAIGYGNRSIYYDLYDNTLNIISNTDGDIILRVVGIKL